MFPYIEVSGTHRQIGEAIGEALRKDIAKAMKMHFGRLQARGIKNAPAHVAMLTKTAGKYFPDFVEELEGIAAGSNQPLERLFLFSFEEELSPGEHCTTLAVKAKGTIYFAHNEDWDLNLPLYIIKAKPKNKPRFLALAQAGQFPGMVGFNDRGLVFSNNSLDTKVNFKGLPKLYCLRKFLECSTIDEAVSTVANHDRAIGNSSLLVSSRESRIVSLEWTPDDYLVEEAGHGLGHTNHFLSKKLKSQQAGKTTLSSRQRLLYLQENLLSLENPGLDDIKDIMRAHINSKVSICRHSAWKTLASVIVDTKARRMLVAAGTPCNHPYRAYSLV